MTGPVSEPAAVLDAVCCVQFCAAGKHGLLLTLLTQLDWEILVPGEVSKEVLGKVHKYPSVTTPWKKFIANDRVTVLPEIVLTDPTQDDVRRKVAQMRGTTAGLALGMRADLGEHIVVGHGVVLKQRGRRVFVLIDDQGGQMLANAEGLTVIDMERLLLLGHRLPLAELDTKAKVKAVYQQLEPFGGSLAPWKSSRLKAEL